MLSLQKPIKEFVLIEGCMPDKPQNKLFYGDNLGILRDYIQSESVDLVYLDPPFNSNRSYNVLFKEESGKESESQITAFEDTWHWNSSAEETYQRLVTEGDERVSVIIGAMRQFIGANQMMAYLVMMTARLAELHRVLKPTGSLYLHCDPTASHYIKLLLDAIFGPLNFRNEIVWKRTSSHNDARRQFGDVTDVILFFTKSDHYTFNLLYMPYSQSYIDTFYVHQDPDGRRWRRSDLRSPNPRPNLMYDYKGYKPHPNGWAVSLERMKQLDSEGRLHIPKKVGGRIQLKRYLDEMPGQPVSNVWDDIPPIHALTAERLGYPTQKPIALLERIISASSNPGDVVLDSFCGCGTAIIAAEKLSRQWIGIDITHLSIALQKYRLKAAFNLDEKKDYQVIGEPPDLGSARQLAQDDRYQFQWWALSLVKARPLGGESGSKQGKKGSDKGIDGVITFIDEANAKPKRILVQVKSGKVKSGDIRDLRGTIEREGAAMGIFITLEESSRDMKTEAVAAGYYRSIGWGKDYPKIQILTIDELLKGQEAKLPPASITFKQAERTPEAPKEEQRPLF
jgi:site-specific DNA-methyltransferase (adenine-specific)